MVDQVFSVVLWWFLSDLKRFEGRFGQETVRTQSCGWPRRLLRACRHEELIRIAWYIGLISRYMDNVKLDHYAKEPLESTARRRRAAAPSK